MTSTLIFIGQKNQTIIPKELRGERNETRSFAMISLIETKFSVMVFLKA